MAGSVAHVCVRAPWCPLVVLLVTLLAAKATPLVCAGDTIAADRPLSGDEKLVSRGGKFALGFFQPDEGAADRWYVGIWYHNISVRTLVWVANRDRLVSDPAAWRLTVMAAGNLVLLDPFGSRAWSTDVISNASRTVLAILLDTGNLVLALSRNASDVLWQSFDHVGDTWLPGGKLRRDKVTGVVQGMTSWRSRTDPAPGLYKLQFDSTGAQAYMLLHSEAGVYYRGVNPMFAELAGYRFRFVVNDRESYFTYDFTDNSTVYRVVVDVSGQLKGLLWVQDSQEWKLMYAEPERGCVVPRVCGAFAVCNNVAFDTCLCVRGFHLPDAAHSNYTGGCVRNAELPCGKNSNSGAGQLKPEEDMFYLMDTMRFPDDGLVTAGASSSGDCERACLSYCKCSAYAYNGGCILWHSDLQNLRNAYDWSYGSPYC